MDEVHDYLVSRLQQLQHMPPAMRMNLADANEEERFSIHSPYEQCGKQIVAHMPQWVTEKPGRWPTGAVMTVWHSTVRTCRQPLRGADATLRARNCCAGTRCGTTPCAGTCANPPQSVLRHMTTWPTTGPAQCIARPETCSGTWMAHHPFVVHYGAAMRGKVMVTNCCFDIN